MTKSKGHKAEQLLSLSIPHIHVPHAFFTRKGGVSTGIYTSLNCGIGSADQLALTQKNRKIALESITLDPKSLITLYQTHSTDVLVINKDHPKDYLNGSRIEGDAMVTNKKNITLGIVTADCCPVLFSDHVNQIIGAAHAGWKGAIGGILNNTINTMLSLGAQIEHIQAAIGPTIAQESYEVDQTFYQRFIPEDGSNRDLFIPSKRAQHYLFDLPKYNVRQLILAGIRPTHIYNIDRNTYAEPDMFFSYRRSCHLNEPDYGRLLSVISLG